MIKTVKYYRSIELSKILIRVGSKVYDLNHTINTPERMNDLALINMIARTNTPLFDLNDRDEFEEFQDIGDVYEITRDEAVDGVSCD